MLLLEAGGAGFFVHGFLLFQYCFRDGFDSFSPYSIAGHKEFSQPTATPQKVGHGHCTVFADEVSCQV